MITDKELDAIGLDLVQKTLDRGDWVDAVDITTVNAWLSRAKREQEFLNKCERANVTSALYSKRFSIAAVVISGLALLVSIVALFH